MAANLARDLAAEYSQYFTGIIALAVGLAAIRVLFERNVDLPISPRALSLVRGIALAWTCGGLIRLWALTTRHAGWMPPAVDGAVIVILSGLIVAGGLLHLDTFTTMKCGVGTWWRVAIAAAAGAGGLTWAF